MTYMKPRPNMDFEIAPFWEAAAKHEFRLVRCTTCGAWYFPFTYCKNHDVGPFGAEMEWAPASGHGTVFAFNIHRVAWDPEFAADVPYVYALIKLDEGPMFSTNIVECAPEDVRIGAPVEIFFVDYEDDVTLPKARLCPA